MKIVATVKGLSLGLWATQRGKTAGKACLLLQFALYKPARRASQVH
jgi:hypothetical protein